MHLVFTLPRELRTSLGVPTYFDDQDTTMLQTFDLTVHDLNKFFNEVEFFVDLDFIQRYSKGLGFPSYVGIALLTIMGGLDVALELNNLLGCLMDDLWASELTISNFSQSDSALWSDCKKCEVNLPSPSEMIKTGTPCLETTSFKYCLIKISKESSSLIDSVFTSLGKTLLLLVPHHGWPDITFVVGKLSGYTSNPGTQHWQAIQRASKKQTSITGSTIESEFVALATAGKKAEWLKNLLLKILLWSKPIAHISIRCDSATTLAKDYSQMYNRKSRHLVSYKAEATSPLMNILQSADKDHQRPLNFIRDMNSLLPLFESGCSMTNETTLRTSSHLTDLEVAFKRNTCFVRNLEGVNLLKGNCITNLYTINLHEMASASLIWLMARATSTKFCLWHQRLFHLNFDTINKLAKNDLVTGLPKFRYSKEHLGRSYEQEKSKTAPPKPKLVPNSKQRMHLLQMNLCRPMRVESVNRKRYVLAKAIATTFYTQNHSLIHRRFHKMPYELINDRKPNISFLHVFEAFCYPKNDREDIGKLGTIGDIGFFIGYYANSCAYRVYNRRTKKFIETTNVIFDELSAIAFDQRSSKPKF
nr:zinc finger, CCHC-type [Tanacetum cinerariifolium]